MNRRSFLTAVGSMLMAVPGAKAAKQMLSPEPLRLPYSWLHMQVSKCDEGQRFFFAHYVDAVLKLRSRHAVEDGWMFRPDWFERSGMPKMLRWQGATNRHTLRLGSMPLPLPPRSLVLTRCKSWRGEDRRMEVEFVFSSVWKTYLDDRGIELVTYPPGVYREAESIEPRGFPALLDLGEMVYPIEEPITISHELTPDLLRNGACTVNEVRASSHL